MSASHYPLLIVGAGAAGLGASRRATKLGISHRVLEASHRLGGRALTERLGNGVPVDLGCHWMHSASINDMVKRADALGFRYARGNPDPVAVVGPEARDGEFVEARQRAFDRVESSIAHRKDDGSRRAIWDHMEPGNSHTAWMSYWYGLMHSNDPDQVDIADITDYRETGEDWPLEAGYGALIEAAGSGAPVSLNTPVNAIHRKQSTLTVEAGDVRYTADRVIVTVSTGVLAAGHIRFDPELPVSHQQAVASLPLGNYNYLIFALKPGALANAPRAVMYEDDTDCAYINVRPFDQDVILTAVAGRFAWWLEKQGERASERWFRDLLIRWYGKDIEDDLTQFRASAWGFDPWTLGAYSSLKPGAGPMRAKLAEPIENCLWFAGEATSPDAFNTAHGAWRAGEDAADAVARSLKDAGR